jgi:cobalt/nickel transport system permease protein
MHIAEGILPASWAVVWWAVAATFVSFGLRQLKARSVVDPRSFQLAALLGAAVFVISCLPIPVPVVGSTSHACGVGMAAILTSPLIAVVIASVALALQALFLGHGGLSTLGANIVSMGVVGAVSGYLAFQIARRSGVPVWGAAFLAGLTADWMTYAATSIEIALALHGQKPVLTVFVAVLAGFAPTQVPLGVLEGLVSGSAYALIAQRRPELLHLLAARKPR